MADRPALQVEDLHITFHTRTADVEAVDGISFAVNSGQVLGIVGESGSGKSATALACLGLLPAYAEISGQILIDGQDLVAAPEPRREAMRGKQIAMVFQDALASLNPYRTIGRQIAEAYRLRNQASTAQAKARAVEMLGLVGMTDPAARAEQYPHELSGGMRQRAMIAMAIVNDPDVLIADEPTTALDVTVQAQVLDLLTDLTQRLGMAMVLITHDLGVIAQVADQVLVMYAGRVAERGTVYDVFDHPNHPYTLGLHAATPDMEQPQQRLLSVPGVPASGVNRPSGCAFHPRCGLQPRVGEICRTTIPLLTSRSGADHVAACHGTEPGGPGFPAPTGQSTPTAPPAAGSAPSDAQEMNP